MRKRTKEEKRQITRLPLFITLFFAFIYLAMFLCNGHFFLPESVVDFVDYKEVSRLFDLPALYLSVVLLIFFIQKNKDDEVFFPILLTLIEIFFSAIIIAVISYFTGINGWILMAIFMAMFWIIFFYESKTIPVSALLFFIILLFLKGFINALVVVAISGVTLAIFLPTLCFISKKKLGYLLFWLGLRETEDGEKKN